MPFGQFEPAAPAAQRLKTACAAAATILPTAAAAILSAAAATTTVSAAVSSSSISSHRQPVQQQPQQQAPAEPHPAMDSLIYPFLMRNISRPQKPNATPTLHRADRRKRWSRSTLARAGNRKRRWWRPVGHYRVKPTWWISCRDRSSPASSWIWRRALKRRAFPTCRAIWRARCRFRRCAW